MKWMKTVIPIILAILLAVMIAVPAEEQKPETEAAYTEYDEREVQDSCMDRDGWMKFRFRWAEVRK